MNSSGIHLRKNLGLECIVVEDDLYLYCISRGIISASSRIGCTSASKRYLLSFWEQRERQWKIEKRAGQSKTLQLFVTTNALMSDENQTSDELHWVNPRSSQWRNFLFRLLANLLPSFSWSSAGSTISIPLNIPWRVACPMHRNDRLRSPSLIYSCILKPTSGGQKQKLSRPEWSK